MRRALAPLVLAALAGCARSAPVSGPASPIATKPSRAATSSPTPVPVHVSGEGNSNQPTILTETVHGRRVYTIRALTFKGDIGGSQDGIATLEQPHITFVDKTGTITIADAPKATVTQRDKTVDMTGGVHARTSDGNVLTCDVLRYDGQTERFHGSGHVVLTGPTGLQLAGNYLEGDVRLRDVQVTKDPPR